MADIAFLTERMLRGFGVDLVVHETANALAARGHAVTVYASALDDTASLDSRYVMRHVPTRESLVFPVFEAHARAWAPRIDAGEHDVVLVESFPFYSLIPHLRTPAIAVDHGICPTAGLPLRVQANFAWMRATQYRRHLPHAVAIDVVSSYVRSTLPARLRDRCRVIPNGVDHLPLLGADSGRSMRETLGIGRDEPVALYVGRLDPSSQPYKGTQDLMHVASRLADAAGVRLVMAGRGDTRDAAAIRSAGAIPATNVSTHELAALYAAADIYVTASRWEGFDLPLLEAARAAVPGVALDVGAHPEVTVAGETALLCRDIGNLVASVVLLARDTDLRRSMGTAAAAHAARFTWEGTATQYEDGIEAIIGRSHPGRSPSRTGVKVVRSPTTDTTALILNYGAPLEKLSNLVRSLHEQTHPVDILLVDNASPRNLDALDVIVHDFPRVEVLRLECNHGFAGGVNRGVEQVATEYVLLLNNDTVLDTRAVEEMHKVIVSSPACAGVAPKILFEDDPHLIDSVGNLMDEAGAAYNMGIGQLDIGQYDRVEPTFGPCFAATLLRRVAWTDAEVGPLDESYFMYYEDVDWNFRAGLLGWDFLTAPAAVVFHAHSLSTREHDYGFKYHLIQRNYIKTIFTNFSMGRMLVVVARRVAAMSLRSLVGPFRRESARTLADTLRALPALTRKRMAVQGRSLRQPDEILRFARGESPHFDPVAYKPEVTLENIRDMYRRRYLLTGAEADLRIAQTADALSRSRLRHDGDIVRARLESLVESEPVAVKYFVHEL